LICASGCGYHFSAADPIVDFAGGDSSEDAKEGQADGDDGRPTSVTGKSGAQPTILLNDGGALKAAPLSQPDATVQPVVPRVLPPATAGVTPAARLTVETVVAPNMVTISSAVGPAQPSGTSVGAPVIIACINVVVDLAKRPLRPDDVSPPSAPDAGYALTADVVPVGRLSSIVPILGDLAVSRIHGHFVRQEDGTYHFRCDTKNFTEVDGVEIVQGKAVRLKSGSRIRIGDFYTITYTEEKV
jgi:hypothetical protein